MNILILGTTGVHHPLIAANMLINKFEHGLGSLERYCDMELDRSGFPIYVGSDVEGNRVYTLGVGKELETAKKALTCLLQLFGRSHDQVLITEVRVRGEGWIRLAARLARIPMGHRLNRFISDRVLKTQLSHMESQVAQIRDAVRWAGRDSVDSDFLENVGT